MKKPLTQIPAKPKTFTTKWSTVDGEFVGNYSAFQELAPSQWGKQSPGFGMRLGSLLDIADQVGGTFRRATTNELLISMGKKPLETALGKQQSALEVWLLTVPDQFFEDQVLIRFGAIRLNSGVKHRLITPTNSDQSMHFSLWPANPKRLGDVALAEDFKANPCPACVLSVQMRACVCDFVKVEV